MIDVVRKHLSDTIDAVATKRYSDLRQIDEFVPAAKALRISRILRTLDYGGQISETLVYKDAEIFPLYNKNTNVRTIVADTHMNFIPILILQRSARSRKSFLSTLPMFLL